VSDWAAIDDEGGAGPWMSVGAGVDVNMPGECAVWARLSSLIDSGCRFCSV
jgi:hypothetical protein